MKNEDLRGLKRLYRGRIMFPSSKTSYNEENTSIGEENMQNKKKRIEALRR